MLEKYLDDDSELSFMECDCCSRKFPEGTSLGKYKNNKFCKECWINLYDDKSIDTPWEFATIVQSESNQKLQQLKKRLSTVESQLADLMTRAANYFKHQK